MAGGSAGGARGVPAAINVWTPAAIVGAIAEAGFEDIHVVGGYHGGEPTGHERFLVYLARHP